MARRDEFDDDEGFLDSILNRRNRGGVHPGSLRRILAVTAGLAVLGILAAVLYSTWPEVRADGSDDAVPIIRADATPYKSAPEEPGGMDVPNKDSTIFETLKGEQQAQTGRPENLFEDSEKPVRKEDVFTAEHHEAPPPTDEAAREAVVSKMPVMSKPVVTYENPESAEAPPPVATSLTPLSRAEPVAPVKATPVEPAPVMTAAVPDKSDAKKADAIQPAAGGNFYVQMASVKSEADAKAQWPKFQAQYNELSALSLRVQQANLGAKGMYYRIQGGPLAETDARKLCASINAKKAGSCVIAKR